jgi:hypothetical protein
VGLGVALALAAAWVAARPADAQLVVQMDGMGKGGGKLTDTVKTTVGQKMYFQVAQMNAYRMPILALCQWPMLRAQQRGILLPGKPGKTWLAAVCRRPGTYKVTAYLLYLNPFTGGLCEAVDSCKIICEGKNTQQGGGPKGQIGGGTPFPTDDQPDTGSPDDEEELPDGGTPGIPGPPSVDTPTDTGLVLTDAPTEDPSTLVGFPQGGQQQYGSGGGSQTGSTVPTTGDGKKGGSRGKKDDKGGKGGKKHGK